MKKTVLMLSLMVCFMLAAAVPAFADNMNRTGTYGTNNNGTVGNEIRQDVNRGITNTNRALGTDINTIDGMDNGRVRTNNYRPYATNDDRDFDWGWLGLLGLLGLAGMRNRERDRDRT
ncbi:WGxxGxxG family protein [Paenibacillus vietnamensis]|uniref:WGxxGxxG family protein n=1 Tax=Paenibacillus vietnamensis TaxID=2590547 RepID=UPI001CD158EA|nr:WGxxGxxG family protein [Paenibacillus vietnamensis]